jgi:hypothetical protein
MGFNSGFKGLIVEQDIAFIHDAAFFFFFFLHVCAFA